MTGPGQPRKPNGKSHKLDTRVDSDTYKTLKKIKNIDGDPSWSAFVRRCLIEKAKKAIQNDYKRDQN